MLYEKLTETTAVLIERLPCHTLKMCGYHCTHATHANEGSANIVGFVLLPDHEKGPRAEESINTTYEVLKSERKQLRKR